MTDHDIWVFGVDSSYDELTIEEARRLKANGVQVYAQCLWTGTEQPASRVISLRNAQRAGIPKLIGYISITPRTTGVWHVTAGRSGVPDDLWEALVKVPIDVELAGLRIHHVLEALDRIAQIGKPKDVYTNYQTWVNVLGNPVRPNDTGLWNAFWDDHPDFDFPSARFGYWQDHQVWGEQWSGGTYVHGQFADRNQFRASALGFEIPSGPTIPTPTPPPPEEEIDMSELTIIRDRLVAAGIFQAASAFAQAGLPLPVSLRDQLRWLLGAA